MVLKRWGISQLYHWIQKDPVIDYLELYHLDKKYCPSYVYDFEALPQQKHRDSGQWQQSILSHLETTCRETNSRLVNQPGSVLHEIEKGVEGISNGYLSLRNEHATVDLILNHRVVTYLPFYTEAPPPQDFYTLCFWNSSKTPSLYTYCKIAFAWQLFERLTMRSARCLLISSTGTHSVNPTKYISIVEEGRQWLSDLHEEVVLVDHSPQLLIFFLPNSEKHRAGINKKTGAR